MGLQNNIQAFDQPNIVSTSIWTRSSCYTTFSIANTYHSRYFTCWCWTRKEGPTDAINQARRTLTDCSTTPRNPKTTAKGLARSQYQKQKLVGRGPCPTIQQSSKRKTQKATYRMDGTLRCRRDSCQWISPTKDVTRHNILKVVNGSSLKWYKN